MSAFCLDKHPERSTSCGAPKGHDGPHFSTAQKLAHLGAPSIIGVTTDKLEWGNQVRTRTGIHI